MSRSTRLLWTTAVLSAASFAYLSWLSTAHLSPGEGLKPFDSRVLGYTPDQARLYLSALSPEATSLYLSQVRLWDTLFPALFAFTLGGVIWTRAAGLRPWVRLMVRILPASYVVMDYAENALVAEMLRAGPTSTDAQIAQASRYTVIKWGLAAVSVLLVLWALFWHRGRTHD